jgi:hypothetical protein
MPVARARLDAVLDQVRATLRREAALAAGANTLLSKKEAAALSSTLLQAGDKAVRQRKGTGARVTVEEATAAALDVVRRHVESVNQRTGPGASVLSKDELRRLLAVDPETAGRAARAYELLTGRSAELGGEQASPRGLPDGARRAITDVLADLGQPRAARPVLKDAVARDGGHMVEVESSAYSGAVFVKQVGGRFVVAPAPFDDAVYAKVKSEARRYFDEQFAVDMRAWGATRSEISAARQAFVPVRALLPGESDPWDYVSSHPLVFVIDNESGSDHGVYAAFDPASGDVDIYAFN